MRRKPFSAIFLLIFSLLLSCNQPAAVEQAAGYNAVLRVIDGDTFVIDDGTTKNGTKIRLIGVDAPESRKTDHEDVQFYGKEAKEFLKHFLEGKQVRLEYDVEHHDKYGRTLAYVYLPDGTFINAYLIQQGYANVMTIPPNVTYADSFVLLQREAREAKRGMWSEPVL
ncbi:MAG: thermonuclease family protein [Chitinophagales bacterium]